MAWVTTDDPQQFLAGAGGFLRRRAASNTVPLTAVAGLIAAGPQRSGDEAPLFGWWQAAAGGAVSGAFMHTPPYPLYLAAPPERALAPLADLLALRERRPAGVDGAGADAGAFAAAWTARCGDAAVPALHMRLYRLGALRPPPRPAGSATVASTGDRDVLVDWLTTFGTEVGTWTAGSVPHVDDRIAAGYYTLWHDGTGAPVAVAGVSREVGGARRLGPVFTRADRRGQGYGAAVTAAACRRALDAGTAQLLLFADVDNPVSNRLYRRLGFTALEERRTLRFERATWQGPQK